MADELVVSSFTIDLNKGGDKEQIKIDKLVDAALASGLKTGGTVSVATSATALTVPASPGLVFIKNLDATNYVEVGGNTDTDTIKLSPGYPWAIFALKGTTLYAKANTAACNVAYRIYSL